MSGSTSSTRCYVRPPLRRKKVHLRYNTYLILYYLPLIVSCFLFPNILLLMSLICVGSVDYTLGNVNDYVTLRTNICIPLHVIENQIVNVEDRTFQLKLSTTIYSRDIIVYQPLLNVTLRDSMFCKLHSLHVCIGYTTTWRLIRDLHNRGPKT